MIPSLRRAVRAPEGVASGVTRVAGRPTPARAVAWACAMAHGSAPSDSAACVPRGREWARKRIATVASAAYSGEEAVRVSEALLSLAAPLGMRSATQAKRAVRRGEVWVDGAQAQGLASVVQPGALISLRRRAGGAPPLCLDGVPDELRGVRLIYEDEHVLALVKPAGLPTIAKVGWTCERIAAHLCSPTSALGALARPRACHRLDKPVEGVLLLAKAHGALVGAQRAFELRETRKEYVALVHGAMNLAPLVCDLRLSDQKTDRMLPALTRVEPLSHHKGRKETLTLVRLRPHTGYKHQLRRHLAMLGHSIVGDQRYASRRYKHNEPGDGGADNFIAEVVRGEESDDSDRNAEDHVSRRQAFDAAEVSLVEAGVGGLFLASVSLEVPLANAPGGRLALAIETPARFGARIAYEARQTQAAAGAAKTATSIE